MRFNDWPERLHEILGERAGEKFDWGVNDCALFACDVIRHLTGLDPAASFRERYHDEAGARAVIAEATGGQGLEQLAEKLCAQFGFREVPVLKAQRGDVCYYTSLAGPTLGIVSFDGRSVAGPGDFGLDEVPLRKASRAWHV